MIDRDDRDAFMDDVDDEVLDDFLSDVFGHDAEDSVDLGELELSFIELQFLADAVIDAHNIARDDGQFIQAMIHYRLLRKLLDMNEELEEVHAEAQERPQNPLEQMFSGGGQFGP